MSKDSIIDSLNKVYGKNAVQKAKKTGSQSIQRNSTGSLYIDDITGGGFPKGGMVELFGPESSGKTTLALSTIRETQKTGGIAAFIDIDHCLDRQYCKRLDISDNLILCIPDSGEDALEIAYNLVCCGTIDLIVIDSVAGLTAKNDTVSNTVFRSQERMLWEFCQKIEKIALRNNCTVIFINQLRYRADAVYGQLETTPACKPLMYYCSMRLDIRDLG